MSVYTSNDLEQADRTILASHLTSLERFAKAGKVTQDKPAELGDRLCGATEPCRDTTNQI